MASLYFSDLKVPCHWHSEACVQLHASAVCLDGKGVLILGAAGSGKSSYAAGLIAHGASLIADDQVTCRMHENHILLSAPPPIEGVLAVREHGLMRCAFARQVPLAELRVFSNAPLPETMTFMGAALPCAQATLSADIIGEVVALFAQAKHNGTLLPNEWIAKVA